MRRPGSAGLLAIASACALAILAGVASSAPPADRATERWFAQRVYVGGDGCLILHGAQLAPDSITVLPVGELAQGDSIVVFRQGRPASRVAVSAVLHGDSAAAIAHARGFEYEETGRASQTFPDLALASGIARYLAEPSAVGERADPLAIAELPDSAIVIGSQGRKLSRPEIAKLVAMLGAAIPAAYRQPGALQLGRRFGARDGTAIDELSLGVPIRDRRHGAGALRSVHILRLHVRGGRLLASEVLSRVSGQAEHIDLEPPQLDAHNWADVPDQTIGFLSLDRGATWCRISVDVGYEGIAWRISRLAPGVPAAWDRFLYTNH